MIRRIKFFLLLVITMFSMIFVFSNNEAKAMNFDFENQPINFSQSIVYNARPYNQLLVKEEQQQRLNKISNDINSNSLLTTYPDGKYNSVYEWDYYSMKNYNCYGYAIGELGKYNPGDFSGGTIYNNDGTWKTVNEIGNLVVDDLESLGYISAKTVSSSYTLQPYEVKIALRLGTDSEEYKDFHFMKNSYGNWYHKPGETAVLKRHSDLNISLPWEFEVYYINGWDTSNWDMVYDSSIVYIVYADFPDGCFYMGDNLICPTSIDPFYIK